MPNRNITPLIVTLWRILFSVALGGAWLLASLSCWRVTTFWLRRRTLEGRVRRRFCCSMLATCCTRLWRSLALFAAFKRRRRKTFARSRGRWRYARMTSSSGSSGFKRAKARHVWRLPAGIAVAPGCGRAPGLPFPRSTGDGEPPNERACVAPGSTRPARAEGTRRARTALRGRWTCPWSRCRTASLTGGSTSRRRNILWIFGFDLLFKFRLVRHALPAMLDLWLCNLRLHSWRFRSRRRFRELLGSCDQQFVALHFR